MTKHSPYLTPEGYLKGETQEEKFKNLLSQLSKDLREELRLQK